MPTRLRQTRKKRGTTQMGWGRVGKHRKHAGGRGNAGGQHHHRTWMDKFHPGYFGKVGMRHFHLAKNKYICPSVNVEQLWHLAGGDAVVAKAKENVASGDDSKALLLDVTKLGFFKVLGKGQLPAVPLIVKARFVSKLAEKKILEAGGSVVLTA